MEKDLRAALTKTINEASRDSLVRALIDIMNQANNTQMKEISRVFSDQRMTPAIPNKKRKYGTSSNRVKNLRDLMDEIIESKIFTYLDTADHCRLGGTCRHFYKLSGCVPPQISYVNKVAWNKQIYVPYRSDRSYVINLTRFAMTRSLTINQWVNLNDDDLIHLRKMPLEVLILESKTIFGEGLRHLTGLPLRRLTLHGSMVTDAGLVNLSHMSLEYLSLINWSGHLAGWGLMNLNGMPLVEIEFRVARLADNCLLRLIDLPLQKLHLKSFTAGTLAVSYLARMTHLTDLRCMFIGNVLIQSDFIKLPVRKLRLWRGHVIINDPMLYVVGRMSCIRYLWVADYDNITEAGWAHLQQMKNLQSLRLKNCGVTDSVMRLMPPNLTELNIGSCKDLTDQFLTDARKMFPRLTILNMNHCTWVSDKSVAIMSSLPIKQLDLSYTAVTDKSVAILSSLPITQLDLSRTAVTDSCVDSILSMSLLEQVCLEYCKNISEMVARRLKGKLVRGEGEFYDEDDISDWEENRSCWN